MGETEDLLAPRHGRVAVDDVLPLGQVAELETLGDPVAVRFGGRQRGLDLVIVDQPVLGQVDQEHPARLQPTLLDDPLRFDRQDARLGGEHDQAVVGHPVAPRTQAVAVQGRADLGAVGEADSGGAVPRLHHRGVEAVEVASRRIHLGVVLPRLGDHHQHGVGQGAATQVQQFQHLVEGRRVGTLRVADREQPVEIARDQVGGEQRLTGPHPVAVALDRVDLAVVGEQPVGMSTLPGGEGVGREPRVHQHQR